MLPGRGQIFAENLVISIGTGLQEKDLVKVEASWTGQHLCCEFNHKRYGMDDRNCF